ncbi:MAG: PQQ-binding-like beta-propeller repeat protein [Minwuiales bacterium]|nr:PQQ-binding-like beta-propeller repeat protein [Minwuiales bacterium]
MTTATHRSRRARIGCAAVVCAVLLGGCSDALEDFFREDEAPPLPGERISVLELERTLEPDPRIADLQVRLPRPYVNPHWPQAGGYASHSMQHLALGENIRPAWTASIGKGADGDTRILTSPIVASGIVFTMDAVAQVAAFDARTGRRYWTENLSPDGEEKGEFGGGVAYNGRQLYVATGYGDVFALDPRNGKRIWHRNIGLPIRAEPTVSAGMVFVVSYDNQLHTLSAEDGSVVWTHVGIAEVAGLLGGANPAAASGLVIAPYSSGELFAFRSDNGHVAWSDSLIRRRQITGLSNLSDIRGRPVIDDGRVYAVGHAGRMVAIDLRTGERVWEQEIGGVQTPWIAGDYIYVVTTEAEVVCLSRREGRIRWVQRLDRYEDARDKDGPIQWHGPVLAGDRLLVTSSHGIATAISPYTGRILGSVKLSESAAVAPIVADGTLYILTDDAQLTAWR